MTDTPDHIARQAIAAYRQQSLTDLQIAGRILQLLEEQATPIPAPDPTAAAARLQDLLAQHAAQAQEDAPDNFDLDFDLDFDLHFDPPAPAQPNIFALYEDNIGTIGPMLAEELKEAEERYPAYWITEAFQTAVDENKRSWRYINGILRRWASQGRANYQDQADPPLGGTEQPRRLTPGKHSPPAGAPLWTDTTPEETKPPTPGQYVPS